MESAVVRTEPVFDWVRLLREIRRGNVVPIIGPELMPYHRVLAARLASQLGVASEHAARGIGAVADASRDIPRAEIASALCGLLEEYQERPGALERLASIKEFKLILTTDYASFFERILERGGEKAVTKRFTVEHQPDDVDVFPSGYRCVYHLLGHLERGSIALSRVDQLEYLFHLARDPEKKLFGVLRERKNLLFLGCDLPEWLAGLFLRVLLGRSLDHKDRGLEVVASEAALQGLENISNLTGFLRDNRVQVYPGSAEQFVHELVHRYEALPRASAGQGAVPIPNTKGYAFISYHRPDEAAARQLSEALARAEVDVWFDQARVEPGAPFSLEIQNAIELDSSSFIPLVSHRALDAYRPYFYQEWRWARATHDKQAPRNPFVFPVIVDDRDKASVIERLKREFPDFAAADVPQFVGGSGVSEAFIKQLKTARKRFERQASGKLSDEP